MLFQKTSSRFSKWNFKALFLAHLFIIALVSTLFSNLDHSPFFFLDKACFQFLNGWIEKNVFWQNFWAMANHRMADWVEDACFVVFFYFVIKSTPSGQRIRKAAESLFFILFTATVILLANEVLFRVLLHIQRKSPTLILDSFTNLAEKVTWLKVKFKSPKSFPADHATTALLFLFSFTYLSRHNARITIAAVCYGTFLCLPRLIVGAHWLSDILVGSGSILLFFSSWAFCTPLASTCMQKLEDFLSWALSIRIKKRTPQPHDA